MSHSLRVIARLHSDFSTKFGVPRQSAWYLVAPWPQSSQAKGHLSP